VIEIAPAQARRLRARAHLLGGSGLSPADVVARASTMQGQDQNAVLAAIAMRSAPGTSVDAVRAAFDAGELVRGWPMRGTLFAIRPQDLAGFTRITGPRLGATLRTRRAYVGITDADFELARDVAISALDARAHARDELAALWADAGVPQGPGINYHLVSTLAISGVLMLGRYAGRDQLVERAPVPVEDEASFLARMAAAFFAARGPATVDDFAWWTKLPKSLLVPAIEAVEGLEAVEVAGRRMLVLDDGTVAAPPPRDVVVPAFDEWLLGYRDRSLVASDEVMREVATVNGIFRAARLVDGVVVGRAELGEAERDEV